MKKKFKIIYKAFGKTKRVEVSHVHNMDWGDTADEVMFVCRPEDMYALISPQLKDKKVAVVTSKDWANGEEIDG